MRKWKHILLWLVCVLLLFNMIPPVLAAEGAPFLFEDVTDENAYYYAPVYWAYTHAPQITEGTDATHFSPERACTRAQAVTFLWRAAGMPEPADSAHGFNDVADGAYYEKAVAWAVEQEITKGTTPTAFSPERTCTRAQIVTFLWRAAGTPAPENPETGFSDVAESAYYGEAAAWAVEKGIALGLPQLQFAPEKDCTRGQIVSFLYRAALNEAPEQDDPSNYVGYLSAQATQEGFLACGTGGRLDFISADGKSSPLESGTTEDLLCVFAQGSLVMVSGAKGTLLVSEDSGQSFRAMDLGTQKDLNGAVSFKNTHFAAGEDGLIYRQKAGVWEALQMEAENEIISLITINDYIVAITAQTDVYISADGEHWEYQNFNEVYAGLYPTYVFTKAVGAGESFFVLGYETENSSQPVIMYTEDGETWLQELIGKVNDEYPSDEMDLIVNDVCFTEGKIIGAQDGGKVLCLVDCFVCHEQKQLSAKYDLKATAARQEGVLLCGENFYTHVTSSVQIRQDKIDPQQAYDDFTYGNALVIDVRDASELAQSGYIKGSLNIPLAKLAEGLREAAPSFDRELIFYCGSGMRAQRATEQAVELGYMNAYNLGGLTDLSDGPFEIVKD